ncbi:MAG: hypothetical protein ACE5FT_01190 [Candidatus Nanoarchaeia archaeon]
MRWLILFLLLVPIAHAEVSGFTLSEIVLNNITFEATGGFAGPFYLMAAPGNSSGSLGLVLLIDPSDQTDEGFVELMFQNAIVGALELKASPDNVTLQNAFFTVEDLHFEHAVVPEQRFNGQLNQRPVGGAIALNLQNLSLYDTPTLAIMDNNTQVGTAVIQRILGETDYPVYMPVTGNFTITLNGEPVRRGMLTMVINDSTGINTEDFNYEFGKFDFYRKIRNDSLIYFAQGDLYMLAKHITGPTDIKHDIAWQGSEVNFPDADLDGVPDQFDICPDSPSTEVNFNGCACNQIDCAPGKLCEFGGTKLLCIDHCDDGIQNGDEEAVDCGGSCGACTTPTCEPNNCLDAPKFCNAEGKIVNNCQQCGCPEGSACTEDGCQNTIKVTGLRCKTPSYIPSAGYIDCKEALGPNAYSEDVASLINFHVSKPKGLIAVGGGLGALAKFVPGGLLGGIIAGNRVKKRAEDIIRKRLQQATVCIDTVDMGCTTPDTQCMGPDLLNKHLPEIQREVEAQFGEMAKTSGIAKFIGLKVDLSLNVAAVSPQVSYHCEDIVFNENETCQSLINSGPSDKKADVLIIGAGFFDRKHLDSAVKSIIDHAGTKEGTRNEGLFSIEPWKSNKDRFNFWTVPAGDKIRHALDMNNPSEGLKPVASDAGRFKIQCPQAEYTIILSTQTFRSHCWMGPNAPPCAVSMDYPFRGRLFAHEFGHGFGKLKDEYYNNIKTIETPGKVSGPASVSWPNCKLTQAEAEESWSNLVDNDVGYFQSCGGDCGPECANYIRPTQNSVMRYLELNANNPDKCGAGLSRASFACQGPPFSPWYAVNERQILKEMDRYSLEFEGERPPEETPCIDPDRFGFFNASTTTGLIVNEKGELEPASVKDTCEGDTLKEAICFRPLELDTEIIEPYYYECGNGCENGACKIVNQTCMDSDGENFTTVGTTIGMDALEGYALGNRTDECFNDDTVIEFVCRHWNDPTGKGVMSRIYSPCDFGCSAGACIPDSVTANSITFNISRGVSVIDSLQRGDKMNYNFNGWEYEVELKEEPGRFLNSVVTVNGKLIPLNIVKFNFFNQLTLEILSITNTTEGSLV